MFACKYIFHIQTTWKQMRVRVYYRRFCSPAHAVQSILRWPPTIGAGAKPTSKIDPSSEFVLTQEPSSNCKLLKKWENFIFGLLFWKSTKNRDFLKDFVQSSQFVFSPEASTHSWRRFRACPNWKRWQRKVASVEKQ